MLTKLFNTNEDLHIYRHAYGIRLVKSDRIQEKNPQLYDSGHTVESILKSPFNVYFLDVDSVIQMTNEETVRICGFESMQDAIGRTVKAVFHKQSAEAILQNDVIVINRNKMHITDDTVSRFDDIEHTAISIKCPWYDSNNKIIGLFGCSIVVGEQSFSRSLLEISKLGLLSPSQIISNHHGIYLSKRETEIAHYLMHGKTAKHIAIILGLSQRTVEKHLEHIKIKMKVSTKSELIEKLMSMKLGF